MAKPRQKATSAIAYTLPYTLTWRRSTRYPMCGIMDESTMPGDEDIIFVKEYNFPGQFIKMCEKNSSQSIASSPKKKGKIIFSFFWKHKKQQACRGRGPDSHAYQISGNVLIESLWCLLLTQIADQ